MEMKPIKRKKFTKLQLYRKRYGLKQKHMAILLGIKENTYSHKEIGLSSFKVEEILLIHEALNKLAKRAGDSPITLDDMLLDK